jgi:hypothetical protein
MKKNPILITLIIAILVLALIWGAFYFFQGREKKLETDEELTANWKLYEDQELGLIIKYPSDWENPSKSSRDENKILSIKSEYITIMIEKYSSSQIFEEESLREEKYAGLRGKILDNERVILDEVSAKRITYFNFQYQFQGDVILVKGGEEHNYIIETFIKNVDPEGEKEFILDQVLSTIKFID